MKATELRIGNLISDNGLIVHVTEIDEHGATVVDGDDLASEVYREIKYFSGTPITPEWLERFGAKKHEHGSWYLIKSYYFLEMENGSYQMGILFADNSITYLANLKHVHQLQNLYFALTGEELTIKEPVKS